MTTPLCNHIFADGKHCQCVARRCTRYCCWHSTERDRRRRQVRIVLQPSRRARTGIYLKPLNDADAIRSNIRQVSDALIDERIDSSRGGLILHGLALALGTIPSPTVLGVADRT